MCIVSSLKFVIDSIVGYLYSDYRNTSSLVQKTLEYTYKIVLTICTRFDWPKRTPDFTSIRYYVLIVNYIVSFPRLERNFSDEQLTIKCENEMCI